MFVRCFSCLVFGVCTWCCWVCCRPVLVALLVFFLVISFEFVVDSVGGFSSFVF